MATSKLDPLVEDYLFHHGVKGMKWGVRKDRGGKPKRKSRRQRRQEKRQAQQKAYQKRAAEAFDHAANNPDSLVKVRTEYGHYILTGKQFVAYVYGGGAFDVRTVEIVEPVEKRERQP